MEKFFFMSCVTAIVKWEVRFRSAIKTGTAVCLKQCKAMAPMDGVWIAC